MKHKELLIMRTSLLTAALTLLAACDRAEMPAVESAPVKPAAAAQPEPEVRSEDGYDLWLRYRPIRDDRVLEEYRDAIGCIVAESRSPTLQAAAEELSSGLTGLLGQAVEISSSAACANPLLIGTADSSQAIAQLPLSAGLQELGDGYIIRRVERDGQSAIAIAGRSDSGVLYGAFALLRHLQTHGELDGLALKSQPAIKHRMLNHWDNLDRSVERGYAGRSLWQWDQLPETVSPRYRDYARANASLGINGTVLTNVNADAQVLTPAYLEKVTAIADVLRPYGIKVFLTARFSAPIEIGGLDTADPLSPRVQQWWADKTTEIYRLIPDFGGFLVKANSEGQPGPQDYGRSHAEGANMLADAVAPHGGIVAWRAFVYSTEEPADRIRQAYDEFVPLDGQFRDNVLIQTKNGPLDFQPREPVHPLFGAMRQSPVALELQITKEYLGQDTHLVYLGPWYKEALDTDTFARGPGSTVTRITDGSLYGNDLNMIAGVANIGDDRNWTGSHFNQANWYAFGRLAWDPGLSAEAVAEEWIRATFGNDPETVSVITEMMDTSYPALVDYMTPLGIVHIMAANHHYGPGPWVDDLPRAEWNSTYYHRADRDGIGFDRTETGSNAVEQYFEPLRTTYAKRETVPLDLLLFFHRVGWDETLETGNTLWQELVVRYDRGVASVGAMNASWKALEGKIDQQRFDEVGEFLTIQQHEARWWRDAVLAWFQSVAGLEMPEGHADPAHELDFYMSLDCPRDRDRPRCPDIYEEYDENTETN
jgi:alpha-glucuronidase